MTTKRVLIAGDIVTIPVSFGYIQHGKSKRQRTGSVEVEFVERVNDNEVRVRFGGLTYVVSDGQLI